MNVNGRFEYETCFCKIRSSDIDRSKNNHLNVCYDLREQAGNDPQILSKVMNVDETWCYGCAVVSLKPRHLDWVQDCVFHVKPVYPFPPLCLTTCT